MGPDGTGGETQGGEAQGGETPGQGNNFMEDGQVASQTPPDNPKEPEKSDQEKLTPGHVCFHFLISTSMLFSK